MQKFIECRHIMTNGRKCRAAALRHKPYCLHHAKLHFRTAAKRRLKESTGSDLHDLDALCRATAKAVEALTSPMVDTRRAGLLLYGIQLATNLQKRAVTRSQLTPDPAWLCNDRDGDLSDEPTSSASSAAAIAQTQARGSIAVSHPASTFRASK